MVVNFSLLSVGSGVTYAAVAAKISLRLAFVNLVMHKENSTVKQAMTPKRASIEVISYHGCDDEKGSYSCG